VAEAWRGASVLQKRQASAVATPRRIFLTLQASGFDVNRGVDDGRGPEDSKVSAGAKDSALIEVKLASRSSLNAT
jgi:hypothetical protein